jgi:hypothetical protein
MGIGSPWALDLGGASRKIFSGKTLYFLAEALDGGHQNHIV